MQSDKMKNQYITTTDILANLFTEPLEKLSHHQAVTALGLIQKEEGLLK